MPLKRCRSNNKPGWKFGDSGKCYTYTPGSKESEKEARKQAVKQGVAELGPDKFKKEMDKSKAGEFGRREDILQAMEDSLHGTDRDKSENHS